MAAARLGAKRPVVVGDRLDTDLAGANAAGYDGLLVLTGVSTVVDACLAPPAERPSLIARSIASLGQPHQAPQQLGDRWVIDGSAAWYDSKANVIELEPGQNLDYAIRVTVQAAWDAIAHGFTLTTASIPTIFSSSH